MGREVRMVPPDYKHPTDDCGGLLALLPRSHLQHLIDDFERGQKEAGTLNALKDVLERFSVNLDETYMPEFEEGTATHFCMYENVSEGTPISPPMATKEELARWLTDNKAPAFADETASYEGWLATIEQGWAMTGVMIGGRMMSGVEANLEMDRRNNE